MNLSRISLCLVVVAALLLLTAFSSTDLSDENNLQFKKAQYFQNNQSSIISFESFTKNTLGDPDPIEVIKTKEIRRQKRKLRRERRKLKISRRDFVKRDNKYIRYNARKRSRRVWELSYDVEARRLDSVKLILMGKDPDSLDIIEIHIPNPPVEIHEYDGVRLNFNNINPFIYDINLKEIHTDRINSEELSSSSINVNVQYQIPPIKMLNAKMPLSFALDSEQFRMMQSIDQMSDKVDKLREAKRPDKIEKVLLMESIDQKSSKVRDIVEENRQDRIEEVSTEKVLDRAAPDTTNQILSEEIGTAKPDSVLESEPTQNAQKKAIPQSKIDSIINEKQDLINQYEDSIRKYEVKLDEKFYKFLEDPELVIKDKKQLLEAQNIQAFKLSNQARVLANDLDEINKFVLFHNQFIGVLNMPHNSYSKVNSVRKCLIESFYYDTSLCCIDTTVANLLFKYKDDLIKLRSTLNVVHESGLFDSSVFAFDLGAFQEQINTVAFEVQSINFDSMLKRIRDMNALIREENFRLTYESFDVAENADFLGFNVSFKQAPTLDVPRGKGSFNFDIGFLIREGVKIDITPTLMYEYGVIPAQYYFETEGQDPGFATVVKKQRDQSAMGVGVLMNVYKRSSANFKCGASVGFGVGQDVSPRFSIGPTLIIGRKERAVVSAGPIFGPKVLPIARYGTDQSVEINEDLLQSGVPLETRGIGVGVYFGVGFNLFGAKNKDFFNNGIGRFTD